MARGRDMTKDDDDAGPTSFESGIFVLRVGAVSYAVGLFWNDVDDTFNAAAEARRMSTRSGVDADLFCVRSGSEQYGLGKKADGQAKNMPVLAGHLAESRSGSWCGVFEVADGFYHVAVQDDNVVEDIFLTDAFESRTRFADRVSVNDWPAMYAPESFGVDGSVQTPIEKLLVGKPPRLQDVDRVSSILKYAAFAGVVALAVGGAMWWVKSSDEAEQAAMMARLQAQTKNLPGMQKERPKPPPSPWEGQFKAVDYIAACKEAMARAPIDVPGWRSKGLVCDGQSRVSMVLSRQAELGSGGGTINWVRWALDRRGMQRASASPAGDGNSVNVTWDFASTPEKWKPADVEPSPPGPNLGAIRKYVQSQFEELFVLPKFDTIIQPAAPGPAGTATAADFYKSMKFSFKTTFEPSSFSEILGRVKGLTISKIALDLGNLTYDVEGQANEQLPLPPQSAPNGNQPVAGVPAPVPVAVR